MDWLPLLSTLAGAAIGIVATLIADRNRWKREDAKEALRLRLDVYTQYTTIVKVLGETLRGLAEREHPSDDERAHALREAFRESGMQPRRPRPLGGTRQSSRQDAQAHA
ncbi:hypothetical protein [Streptomyces sp. NRRL WC-3725]|uniref:hypothetical protein n=1 Tax=Streptomyces sp. NRRL WC-3725 TaxID=1463933 RepID=UPI001F3A5EC2|nr:hypothetical protein [Streptomyces sp. NRRL WC-3725]